MNGQRRKRVSASVGLLFAGLGLLLLAGPAAAQCGPDGGAGGSVRGVLRETLDAVTFRHGYRAAEATELGTLSDGCGTLATLEGETVVQARSRIRVVGALPDGTPILGTGPISGVFTVDTVANGSVPGKLDGQLDFSPLYAGLPWVLASGTWSTLASPRTTGDFSGVALVPFSDPTNCPTAVSPSGWCYVDPTGTLPGVPLPTGGTLVPLSPEDFDAQHGTPQATFVITLIQ